MALPALTEDLVEEILLRVSPDEPAHLVRAALVCKAWHSILSDGGFRRRYCRLQQTPPLLGYIHNIRSYAEFVPTIAFSPPLPPPPMPDPRISSRCRALDCRHGRVLIHETGPPAPGLIVWDPITGDRQQVSFPANHDRKLYYFAAAVLCARHGCDHLDCHGGPFLVVYMGMAHATYTWATVYSSETGSWSAQTSTSAHNDYSKFKSLKPSLFIGDTIYLSIACPTMRILKYDLGGHGLSAVDAPKMLGKVAPIDIDGRLGLVESCHNHIYMWSQQPDANGVGGWVRHDVAGLETLIPTRRRSLSRLQYRDHHDVIRFIEGTNTIIFNLNIDQGVFTLDLKSKQVRKVTERWDYDILPYTSFYTPDLCMGKLSPRP